MPEWLIALLSILGTFSVGFLAWLASRRNGDRDRIVKLEERVDDLDRTHLRWQNYAVELREHIFAGKGPPPPPFPLDLTKGNG
jgi:hypothetical protein